ncbi:hypothetical protein HPG69_007082 [Diceros bicornis minor]|uniref:Lysosome-associated membrane glycoprotein 2-like luminal domain-containing protein n=1 Tax=Diceros bicornis minor TaxID=77932 RepID=A0A7J7F342_DICBM|nr:hypothetical protein HPG69_007082 [Diceros bicornis minor]
MAWQRFAMVVLFMSLAVMLHYGNQIRAKVFPEITDYSESTTAATVQAMGKPSLLQPANQVAARSMDGHVTSRIAATTSSPETPITHTTIKTLATTSLVTTNSTPSTSPIISTLLTTLATPNNSHTAAPVTEATIGPSAGPSSPPRTIIPPVHTTGTSQSTVSHTTGKTTQPSNQTTLPATLSTSPQNSTTSQKPAQPTHAPGPTTATHSTTQTASPTTTAPGPTLAPQPSSAKTGTYQVLNGSKLCIKAEMGIELTVQDTGSVFSPQRYFNIDPNATQASGNCDFRKSNLLLNFRGGFVNLTFTKPPPCSPRRASMPLRGDLALGNLATGALCKPLKGGSSQRFLDVVTTMLSKKGLIDVEDRIHTLNICDYETLTIQFAEVKERTLGLTVIDSHHLSPSQHLANFDSVQIEGNLDTGPVLLHHQDELSVDNENAYYISEVGAYLTVSNPEKIYQGMKSSVVMFETVIGHSFKCVSEQSIQLSTCLQLKTVNVQLQAFDFEDNTFGNVDECSSDYTIVLPVIGAIVLGLCAVGLIVYGVRLRREASGYQRI